MNRVLLLGNIRPSLRLGLALLLALALLASPLAATPAAATEKPSDHQYKERHNDNDDNDNDDNDNNNRHHKKNNNRNNNNGGGGGAFEVAQESEQEAESSDINQSFTVTQTGDNSTQCAGVQGDAQTGNAQNLTDLEQVNSEADEFEFEEVGSTIDASPTSDTTCDQQVNQAAAANASSDAAGASADSCYTASDGWYYCHWTGWGTYYWDPYSSQWIYWSPVSNVATEALGTAGGLTTLGTLATLGLVGTGLVIRRTRSD